MIEKQWRNGNAEEDPRSLSGRGESRKKMVKKKPSLGGVRKKLYFGEKRPIYREFAG